MKIFNKKWISCLFLAVVTVEYSSHKIQAMDLGLEKWTKTWTPASLLPCGLAASYVSKNFLYEPVKKICDSVREYAPQSWKPWITPETMGNIACLGGVASKVINIAKIGNNKSDLYSDLYASASLGLVLVDIFASYVSRHFLYEPAKKICDSVREYAPQSWQPWITPETMGKMAWLGGFASISYYAYNGHNAYNAVCDKVFEGLNSREFYSVPLSEYRACEESPVIPLYQFLPLCLWHGLLERGEQEKARRQLEQIRRWGEENEPIRQRLEQIGQGQEQIMHRIEQFTQRRARDQGRMRQQEQELQRIVQDQEIIGQRREELGQRIMQELEQEIQEIQQDQERIRHWEEEQERIRQQLEQDRQQWEQEQDQEPIRQRREELRQHLERLRYQLEQIRELEEEFIPRVEQQLEQLIQRQERARVVLKQVVALTAPAA